MGHYRGKKSKGRHTTHLDTGWVKKLIKKAQGEPTVKKINLGTISKKSGKTRSPYSAKKVAVGIEITAFSAAMKQTIIIYTDCPQKTAKALGINLK